MSGRGGRGQALLAALGQPVRKPGQQPSGTGEADSGGASAWKPQVLESTVDPPPTLDQPQAGSTLPVGFPIGRGVRTKLLTKTAEPAQTIPPLQPFGRGLRSRLAEPAPSEASPRSRGPAAPTPQTAALPKLEEAAGPTPGSGSTTPRLGPTPGSGRGAELLKHGSAEAPKPTRQPVTGSPTSGMKGLSLGEGPSTTSSVKELAVKKGTAGQKAQLNANYLTLQGKSAGVYQYAVSFQPMVESKNHRFGMISDQSEILGKTRAFDGSTLYLPKKLTDTSLVLDATRKTDGASITITITLVATVQYVQCFQLFNVIFRRVMRALELTQVGRNYYDPHSPIALPQHKMELWPGYVSSIQQLDGGLLLMFDVAHRLLRTDTALDFLYELYSANKSTFQDQATKLLVGCVVLTRYNNKTYRIDDIAWDKNPCSTFLDHKGNSICFLDYYKNVYGKVISDEQQPLLINRPKPRDRRDPAVEEVICLVPELCSMTGLTDQARQDFKIMKDIATHTRIAPSQREVSFRKFVDRVNKCPKAREELENWGLQLNPRMVQLEGRTLNPEKIMFKKSSVSAGLEADWGRQVVKENVISAVPLRNWVLVSTKRDSSKAFEFKEMMKKVCPPLGIEVADPKILDLANDRTDTYLQAIKQVLNAKLQLVVAVFPTSRDDRYAAFKKFCCVESPVPSQVINARTISKPQMLRSVSQKIALQINCKLGGELWAVELPLKNVMVVGVDVYHDSAQGQKRSILGFVASTNQYLTRWYSRVAIQGIRQEIADGLKVCFQAALKNYHELNDTLPERIVVFRDGVGDGQMNTVAQYEVPQITSCFSEFGADFQPKLAVVVVQKRISTRIFSRGGPKGLTNPPPGTVVDHTITRRGWYDFFLVSQHVRQGTVTPTHYNVVYDESALKPDHMQRLTYKLTHMYYNWPGTIRVPAPCQYAHKLAFLVGQSLHKDPSIKLSNRLFFL